MIQYYTPFDFIDRGRREQKTWMIMCVGDSELGQARHDELKRY